MITRYTITILLFAVLASAAFADNRLSQNGSSRAQIASIKALSRQLNWYNQERTLAGLNQIAEIASSSTFHEVKVSAVEIIQKIVFAPSPFLDSKVDTVEPLKTIALSTVENELQSRILGLLGTVGKSTNERVSKAAIEAMVKMAQQPKKEGLRQKALAELKKIQHTKLVAEVK